MENMEGFIPAKVELGNTNSQKPEKEMGANGAFDQENQKTLEYMSNMNNTPIGWFLEQAVHDPELVAKGNDFAKRYLQAESNEEKKNITNEFHKYVEAL